MSRGGRGTTSRALGLAALLVVAAGLGTAADARDASGVYLEDLTTTELRDRIAAGATIALLPIGGTEQSGPYLALGKHNARAGLLAGRIAAKLGNAIVAPTLAYVPEGSIDPPSGHMRFAGTISIPEAAFESVLDASARSLCRAGFRTVFFLGDHGDYQKNEERVAAHFDRGAAAGGCRVVALTEYYRVTQSDYLADLRARGFGADEIGTHAGLADTALSLALDPAGVRADAMSHAARPTAAEGVHGDPRRATAALGELGVARIVDRSVKRIRDASR